MRNAGGSLGVAQFVTTLGVGLSEGGQICMRNAVRPLSVAQFVTTLRKVGTCPTDDGGRFGIFCPTTPRPPGPSAILGTEPLQLSA